VIDVPSADLHLTGASTTDANLKAVPVGGITVDFDGDARSGTTPTIGADEPSATCTVPAITTQPAAQTACAGSSATFNVVASGTNNSYQWRKGGTPINGAFGASYVIASPVAGDAGNYDVVVTNACGTVTSAAVALTVNPATVITAQTSVISLCVNNPANFSVTASGVNLTYQWRKNGVNISGATSATYSIASTPTSAAGTYDVVVSGTCGSVTSRPIPLTVNACTAIPNVDADVTGVMLMPNVVRNNTVLRVQARKAMKIEWTVLDAQGREVMKFTQNVNAGQNNLTLALDKLTAGSYYLSGSNSNGHVSTISLFKK
jgi:hypothetical protein